MVAALPPPDGPVGFVHGDLWQGNTLWDDGEHVGTLDWDYAGVGHPIVDIGSLRWDLAVLGGGGHDELVTGWEEASGATLAVETVARADLVAVLASPPDLALWLPNFHAQGRPDLTLDLVTARRDTFVRARPRRSSAEPFRVRKGAGSGALRTRNGVIGQAPGHGRPLHRTPSLRHLPRPVPPGRAEPDARPPAATWS